MIWLVIWVVLMILWIAFGAYHMPDRSPPSLGGLLVPWFCVLILGLVVFGAVGPVVIHEMR